MKNFDITRPDKLILSGLKTLGNITNITLDLHSQEKTRAKERGEIAFIGEKKLSEVKTQLFVYTEDELSRQDQLEHFDVLREMAPDKVYWLNFHGLHEIEKIKEVGEKANLDRLTLRQLLDTTLRPKVEEYEHYVFFSVKSILASENESEDLHREQLSFVLGDNYVISFQEEENDHFDHIRNKIVEKLGLVRKKGSDFLLYQLLDAILDNYFETIEGINAEVKSMESVVLKTPSQAVLVKLEHTKRMAEMITKSLKPFKDSLRALLNRKTSLISPGSQKYFQDLMSNCSSAIEEIEATSNSLESLTNIYFSAQSQKMNETMKVLTTVATIFIPLTFIAGIYGMNFENMPELSHPYGYFYVWGVMILLLIGMLVYFKRKSWL